jgi:hypothetical protein
MSSQLFQVTLHPADPPLRFTARVRELPECAAFARSMRHLYGAINEAILNQLNDQGPVRLVWETPVEEWVRHMWAAKPVRVLAELESVESALLTHRPRSDLADPGVRSAKSE